MKNSNKTILFQFFPRGVSQNLHWRSQKELYKKLHDEMGQWVCNNFCAFLLPAPPS